MKFMNIIMEFDEVHNDRKNINEVHKERISYWDLMKFIMIEWT